MVLLHVAILYHILLKKVAAQNKAVSLGYRELADYCKAQARSCCKLKVACLVGLGFGEPLSQVVYYRICVKRIIPRSLGCVCIYAATTTSMLSLVAPTMT